MAGYTRTDTTNNIANGNVINANDLDSEYNAVEAAFNASSGHKHDGTAAEGAPITKVGPSQDLIVSSSSVLPKTPNTLDLGSVGVQFKDGYFDGVLYADSSRHGVNGLTSIGDNVYTVSSGGLSVDVDGDITLNPTGLDVVLASSGTPYGSLTNTSSNLTIKSGTTTAITLTGANTQLAGTLGVTGASTLSGTLGVTGDITVTGTVDGIDIATRDGILTSTTTTAGAALPKAGGAMTGAITTNSTFDGRDVATDGTKLDGIEASADVTDTTNVVAALTAGSNITIASDGTIAGNAAYSLPITSTTTLGGMKIGSRLSVNSSTGVVSATGTSISTVRSASQIYITSSTGNSGILNAATSIYAGLFLPADKTLLSYVSITSSNGSNAASAGTQSVAIGESAQAFESASVAIGLGASTIQNTSYYEPGSIAIGYDSNTTGEGAISMGCFAAGNGNGATSIGDRSDATGIGATAVGAYSQAIGVKAVAIGGNGQASNLNNGLTGTTAYNDYGIAIGSSCQSFGEYSIAIGGTARGASNTSTGLSSIAIGKFSIISTNAFGGVAIGQQTSCGYNSVSQEGNVAIGSKAKARNRGAISIGYDADCVSGSGGSGVYNVAIGQQATVSGGSNNGNSVALGYSASVTTSNTIRLGNTSITSLLCQDQTISTSDVRDKTDFEALNYGLDFVKAIPTYKYKRNNRGEYYTLSLEKDDDGNPIYTYDETGYNNKTKKLDRVDFGFKAQEVEALIQANERLVSTTTEPEGFELKSFAQSDMVPILWKAVQELSAKNDALEARIVALEA